MAQWAIQVNSIKDADLYTTKPLTLVPIKIKIKGKLIRNEEDIGELFDIIKPKNPWINDITLEHPRNISKMIIIIINTFKAIKSLLLISIQ